MKILFYLFFLTYGDTCREAYLREVLQNTKGVDYFLVVKATRRVDKEKYIVLSCSELLSNLKKEYFVSEDSIIRKIKDRVFFLPISDSSRFFTVVKHYKDVENTAKKGKKYFLERYFDKWGYLKHDIPFKFTGHIIDVLFSWSILVKEIEGNVHIDRKNFCYDSTQNRIQKSLFLGK